MLKGFPVKILSSALLLFKLRGKKSDGGKYIPERRRMKIWMRSCAAEREFWRTWTPYAFDEIILLRLRNRSYRSPFNISLPPTIKRKPQNILSSMEKNFLESTHDGYQPLITVS